MKFKNILIFVVALFATSIVFAQESAEVVADSQIKEEPKATYSAGLLSKVVDTQIEEEPVTTTYSAGLLRYFVSYDISKLKCIEDSDYDTDMKGFTVGMIGSSNITKNNTKPIYLDFGYFFTYGRWKDDDSDYYKECKFTYFSFNIPLGLSYRAAISDKAYLVPQAGLNFRIGAGAERETVTEKSTSWGSTESTERIDFYDKDEMGDDAWKRFSVGCNFGVNLEIDNLLIGFNYMSDFGEVTEGMKFHNASIRVGFLF